jgi:PAS domain S-box-containing protein
MTCAIALSHALWSLVRPTPFLLGFGAAVLSSRIGGRRAGLVAVVTGAVGYAVFPPFTATEDLGSLIVGFTVISSSASWIIARRYEIEAELRASRARLAEAQQLAHVGNWERMVFEGTDWWSDEIYRIVGVEVGSVRPSFATLLRFLHPDDRARVDGVFQQALSEQQPFVCEGRVVRPNGDIRAVRIQGRVEADGSRQVHRIVGTAQDVTDRKEAEQALVRSERRLKTIIDAQPACVTLVSPDGDLMELNPAGLRLLGAERLSEVLSRPLADFVHADERESFLCAHRAASAGSSARLEFRLVDLSGETRWVDSHMVAFDAGQESDAVRPVISVTSDITDRKRLEEQLRHSQKMEAVGRLAGGIAHDFNNLLTVIGGLSEMAAEQAPDNSQLAADIAGIRNAALSAGVLTKRLLLFSRKQKVEKRSVDLVELTRAVRELLCRTIREDIRIDIQAAADLRRVTADPTQIEQVLMNLALNARDAMPGGGRLLVEARNVDLTGHSARAVGVLPGGYVRLTVSDTGCGMDQRTLSRIFEPFFTTKKGGRGTGLGLSMTYAIVQQHAGAIQVESELGRGSTFKLYFPESRSATETLAPKPESERPTRGCGTVLLVEDDDSVRAFAARVLRSGGYRVLEACSAAQVFRDILPASPRVDAVLTDIIMPETNGYELARRMRTTYPDAKVLYMSGYTDRRHSTSDEEADLLDKPFTATELLRRMQSALS